MKFKLHKIEHMFYNDIIKDAKRCQDKKEWYEFMKTLIIEIAQGDLEILSSSHYILCVAKVLTDENSLVIWQTEERILAHNEMSWEENANYSLFCSNNNTNRKKVVMNIPDKEIALGEYLTLTETGTFGDSKQGPWNDQLGLINQYGSIYPGICQQCTDFNGAASKDPIFLNPTPSLPGEFTIKPLEKIMVWFEQDVEKGMYLFHNWTDSVQAAKTKKITVDMQEKDQITLSYENYDWKIL